MVLGAVLVMAASPPVAGRIGSRTAFCLETVNFFMPQQHHAGHIHPTHDLFNIISFGLVLISGLMIATVLIGPEVKEQQGG